MEPPEDDKQKPDDSPGEIKILSFKRPPPEPTNEEYTRTCGECDGPFWLNHFDELGNKWHECANPHCQALYDSNYEPFDEE